MCAVGDAETHQDQSTRCMILQIFVFARCLMRPAAPQSRQGTHNHHESAVQRGGEWWLLDAVRVSLLNDDVDLGREDVFVQGEVPVVAVAEPTEIKHTAIPRSERANTNQV